MNDLILNELKKSECKRKQIMQTTICSKLLSNDSELRPTNSLLRNLIIRNQFRNKHFDPCRSTHILKKIFDYEPEANLKKYKVMISEIIFNHN